MSFRNAQQPGGNNQGDYDDADYEDDEEYIEEDEEVDETDEDEEDDEEYDGQIEEGENYPMLASSSCQLDLAKNFCSDLVDTYTLATYCSRGRQRGRATTVCSAWSWTTSRWFSTLFNAHGTHSCDILERTCFVQVPVFLLAQLGQASQTFQ